MLISTTFHVCFLLKNPVSVPSDRKTKIEYPNICQFHLFSSFLDVGIIFLFVKAFYNGFKEWK